MLIHLMQHGQALPKEINSHQPLSPVGRDQVTKTAEAARILGLRFELVVSSPKPRALETAEIMSQHTGYPVSRIQVTDAAKAMAPTGEIIQFIKEYQGLDSIFVTGHLPSLRLMASFLLTGKQTLDIAIDNGGLMQIDWNLEEQRSTLNWYLSPAQLALIAG